MTMTMMMATIRLIPKFNKKLLRMRMTIIKITKMMTKLMTTIKTMTMTIKIATMIMIMMAIRSKLPRNPNKMKIVNNSFYHKTATIINPNK
jgi:hypothetical protein